MVNLGKFKKKLAVMMIILIIASVTGCNKPNDSMTSKEQGGSKQSQQSKGYKHNPAKLYNPNISILTNNDMNIYESQAIIEFENKYGGKIDIVKVTNAEKKQKFTTSLMAGTPYDVIILGEADMRQYTNQKLLSPIDEYIDLNDPIWEGNIRYLLSGHYYSVMRDVVSWIIFYNKTMFENNGEKTPMEYYKDNAWTFENLKKAGMAMTQDINKDGIMDIIGLGIDSPELFTLANGGSTIEYDNDGRAKLVINDSKVIDALTFQQEAIYKYKYVQTKAQDNLVLDFISGKYSMVGLRQNIPDKSLPDMKYEWDIAPFPQGPGASTYVCPGGSGSFTFSKEIKNPEAAAAYVATVLRVKNTIEPDLSVKSEAQVKLIKELNKSVHLISHNGVGDATSIIKSGVYNQLTKGLPVQSLVDSVIPKLEDEINKFNSNFNNN